MYRFDELTALVYRDLAHPDTDNDRLKVEIVHAAINQGFKYLAQVSRAFARSEQCPAVTDQGQYAIFPDFISLRAVHYDDLATRLRESSRRAMETESRLWRSAAGGTPEKWLWWDARQIYLHPKPAFATGTHDILMEALIGPYSIGGGIATIARTGQGSSVTISTAARVSNVVTIVTATPHGLVATDTVVIAGVTPVGATSFNGTFTVVSAADTTHFTYAQVAANDTGSGGTMNEVTASVVTVTTQEPHKLHRLGMKVVIYGVTASTFDGTFAITDFATDPKKFTYAQALGDAASSGGIAGYENGVLPLYKDSDTPPLLAPHQLALVDFAVSILASGYLLNAQEAATRVQAATARLEATAGQLGAMLE